MSFFVCGVYAQGIDSAINTKDNFNLYLYGKQSELLEDYASAKQLYDLSIFRSDSTIYIPSLLGSLNIRLLMGDYGYDTEKYLKVASSSGIDSSLLTDMMINYKFGNQEFAEAKSLCQKYLSSNPDDRRMLSIIPLTEYYLQLKDSALLHINNFESTYGIDPRLYSIKRELLSEMNLYDSLVSYNRRVSEIYPENLSILADLANVETAVGNDSVAYQLWKYIESQDSTSIQFIASRNFFYSTHGYKNEAIITTAQLLSSEYIKPEAKQKIFSQLFIAVDPDKDSSLMSVMDSIFVNTYSYETDSSFVVRDILLGYFYFRKDYSQCLNILSSLNESFPSIPKYILQKANIYTLQNNFDEAFSILDSSILASPHVTDFVVYKAELIKETQGVKPCLNFIKKAIKSESADSSLSHYYSYLGDLLYKEGSHAASFKSYERALSYNPENALALNNYAYFLALDNSNLDMALGMSHKCNMLIESNATYLDTEAYILFKLKRYKEAKEMMDIALSLSESDVSDEMLLHYADILAAMGNSIQAKDYYKRALNAGADESVISERLKALK